MNETGSTEVKLGHPCETENGIYVHKGTSLVPWTCVKCGLEIMEPIMFQMYIKND